MCSKNKDKKSESNSQLFCAYLIRECCCVRRTKIKNLKAIHNDCNGCQKCKPLCSKNKDKKSESNSQQLRSPQKSVKSCVRRTKIKNLKAIHNRNLFISLLSKLCSKNKDKKSESNSQRLQFNMSGCIPYRRKPPLSFPEKS